MRAQPQEMQNNVFNQLHLDLPTKQAIQHNLFDAIQTACSKTIINIIQQYIQPQNTANNLSCWDHVGQSLTKLCSDEFRRNNPEIRSIKLAYDMLIITSVHLMMSQLITKIERQAITLSTSEEIPNKNYFCMHLTATKDGVTTQCNFLLDLDLTAEILKETKLQYDLPHNLPQDATFNINGIHFTMSHSSKRKITTLEDIRNYVTTSYLGSRILSLFTAPAATVETAEVPETPATVVDNNLDSIIHTYLVENDLITSLEFVMR